MTLICFKTNHLLTYISEAIFGFLAGIILAYFPIRWLYEGRIERFLRASCFYEEWKFPKKNINQQALARPGSSLSSQGQFREGQSVNSDEVGRLRKTGST